ncbi:MAG: SH3 domain-containing protein [Anaerolineales bacterium]|nr:SH3 domain-containing protein [Anaerolineales bacterium]
MQAKNGRQRSAGWLMVTLLAVVLVAGLGGTVLGDDRQPTLSVENLDATATVAALKLMQLQLELQATLTAQALPQTPTLVPTPLPPAAPAAVSQDPTATALVAGLNIRSGPGSGYAVIGNAVLGQQFPVTGQANGCAWLRVLRGDGSVGWISGSPSFTMLNVPCSRACRSRSGAGGSSACPSRDAAPQPAAATKPAPAVVAAPGGAAPAQSGQITSFEPFGNWRRGDEPHGSLTQSSAQVQSGNAARNSSTIFLHQPVAATMSSSCRNRGCGFLKGRRASKCKCMGMVQAIFSMPGLPIQPARRGNSPLGASITAVGRS